MHGFNVKYGLFCTDHKKINREIFITATSMKQACWKVRQ